MKIALLGYNIENASVYNYLSDRHPEAKFTIYDQKSEPARDIPHDVEFVGNMESFDDIDADMVVRSPGISPHKITTSGKITTATQLFFENSPTKNIIGVTGSKGKGTTCSFITSILRAGGFTVHLVGNIGQPALEEMPKIMPDHIVVYELSSFQLWDMTLSPRTAVILMIEPDHLDVHIDMNEYIEAKSHITSYQSIDDILVYQSQNDVTSQLASQSIAHKIPVSSNDGVYVKDGYFWYDEQKLCSDSYVKLQGSHNLDNACAAIAACWSMVQDLDAIARGLSEFNGLDHRLKNIATVDGVDYYDDSIATTPGSAIASIRAFSRPKILILGGSDKGANYQPLADAIAQNETMKLVVTIGSNGDKIADVLEKSGIDIVSRQSSMKTMDQIVDFVRTRAEPGDVVVLSPAAASFDMFKNYKDRGEQFINSVNRPA